MHDSSMKRMEWFVKTFVDSNREIKVLDVGSYDVNGSYRELFSDDRFKYTGLDMADGPNVDIVPEATYQWKEIENDTYDITISGQALEHIEFFWITMGEIVRTTAKDGLICIIAPNGFKEHRYPVDCWRFFTDGMIALAKYYELEIIHAHTNAAPRVEDQAWFSDSEADSMLIARKRYSGKPKVINLEKYHCIPTDHEQIGNGMKSYEEHLESVIEKEQKYGEYGNE